MLPEPSNAPRFLLKPRFWNPSPNSGHGTEHPQPNDRLLLTGIRPHFSALSEDDHVSSLSHQLGSPGVLAHVVLLCPRGVAEFYPHTDFRSADIRKDKRHCCLRGWAHREIDAVRYVGCPVSLWQQYVSPDRRSGNWFPFGVPFGTSPCKHLCRFLRTGDFPTNRSVTGSMNVWTVSIRPCVLHVTKNRKVFSHSWMWRLFAQQMGWPHQSTGNPRSPGCVRLGFVQSDTVQRPIKANVFFWLCLVPS